MSDGPTGITILPLSASCSIKLFGMDGAAAETRIAS